ncbi:hypothetical protein SK128_015408 [Halocaridina rubra]|uniref:Uncharacterized protein n=1 Tax=Halocaridina rubra TaxID=373956 RepID=A0AAN8X644_HALRR
MASKRVLSSSAELFYDTTPALTVKSILAQADKVYRNSQIKETEWHNQLKLSEAKAHETIHEEIQRTGSCLKLWEDLFKKETSTLFASSKNAVAQRVAEIKALQDSLAKNMIMVEVWLQNSSKQESFPLQEVIKLLQETSILQEKLRNEELLPNVSLRRAISLTEGSLRHKFWYLVTHDVLPHDVMLQGPSVFKLGLTVFVIQIPSKVNREEVLSLLKCTVEVEGSEPQELRLEWQDDIASIAVDVTQLCIHSISVFLYHQHVCGSPLRFFPSQSLPSKTEETKSRNHINASQQVVESPDSSSLSDDDYMMDKQSFQKRRQNLAGRSLNLLNRHLMKAADQRKNDSSLMDRETKNLVHPVENSVKSSKYIR